MEDQHGQGVGTTGAEDPHRPPPVAGPRPPLRRPREGRIVAGVAAGLSDHLGLDVAIVRILLVVITIVTSGVAILGYGAAVLLIPAAEAGAPRPQPGTRTHAPGSPRDPLFWVGVGLLVVGALWLIGGPLSTVGPRTTGLLGDLAVPLVLIAFGLALWRAGERRGVPTAPLPGQAPPAGAVPTTPPAPPPSAPASWPSTSPIPPAPTRAATTEAPVSTDTPTWTGADRGDPAPGSAPSYATADAVATDTVPMSRRDGGEGSPPPPGTTLPPAEPAWTPPPAPERRRSLLTRITVGLALVTVGVLWILRGAGVIAVTWGQIASAALLVVGIGLLVGSIAGRARWLVLVGALIAPFVLAWQIASPWTPDGLGNALSGVSAVWDDRASGEVRETPTTPEQVRDSYELGAGTIRLDLTELELDGDSLATSVDIGAGEIRVEVPDDVEVEVTGRVGLGELRIFDRDHTAGFNPGERTVTHTPDDPEGRIELDLSAGLGEVRVDLVTVPGD